MAHDDIGQFLGAGAPSAAPVQRPTELTESLEKQRTERSPLKTEAICEGAFRKVSSSLLP